MSRSFSLYPKTCFRPYPLGMPKSITTVVRDFTSWQVKDPMQLALYVGDAPAGHVYHILLKETPMTTATPAQVKATIAEIWSNNSLLGGHSGLKPQVCQPGWPAGCTSWLVPVSLANLYSYYWYLLVGYIIIIAISIGQFLQFLPRYIFSFSQVPFSLFCVCTEITIRSFLYSCWHFYFHLHSYWYLHLHWYFCSYLCVCTSYREMQIWTHIQ